MLLLASSSLVSAQSLAQGAAVSGVVRDASGVAQLGVLVQVTGADSALVARAFTDLRGRYLLTNLRPGHYQVQATGALFVPATRPALQLRAGARAVVNLTMNAIFDTTVWLPVERRKADEPADDWAWTLRAAVNRPILRMVEDGGLVMVSSSSAESRRPSMRGRAAMTSGDGGFGNGGIHNVVTVDTAQADGLGVIVRADTGTGREQLGIAPSTELSAGFEGQTGFASTTRAVTSFQSHPELVSAGGVAGLQTMRMATAYRSRLGDLVSVEGGGALYALHTDGYAFAAQPFVRVTVEPGGGWSAGYRMATSRDLQGFSGLNAVQPELPVAWTSGGKPRTERGKHEEISVGRKLGRRQVQAAVYRDRMDRMALSGGGALPPADLATSGGVADLLTDSFRVAAPGYRASGLNLMLTQPLAANLWAAIEFSTGQALAARAAEDDLAASLPSLISHLQVRRGESATFALKGNLPDTETKLRVVYRWQPHGVLTPVDCYREFTDQAYLSFHVRQPVRWEGVLPAGLEASVDVTNLLAQGYQPFLSADGKTLYLAQSPRTLQAGLSINF